MDDKYLFLIFYIEIAIILGFIIIRLTFYRKQAWFKKSPTFYNLSNIIAIFTLAISTLVLFQQFFISQEAVDKLLDSNTLFGRLTGVFLYVLFLAAAVGIIFAGVKSIKEKESIKVGSGILIEKIKGSDAIIEGIIYLIIGIIFLFGVIYVAKILFF